MSAQRRKKHHYIPKCYLKQWCGADQMLCEYQLFDGRIVPRRVHPSQTGWSENLYAVDTLPPDLIDVVERVFFARVDQEASDALDVLTKSRPLATPKLRSGWSRFTMSLMQRHPGKINELWNSAKQEYRSGLEQHRSTYSAQRGFDDPESFDEFCEINYDYHVGMLFARAIQNSCDMKRVGEHLNNMYQTVFSLHEAGLKFLTSDNPLIINTGIAHAHCRIILPISPRQLFIFTNSEEVLDATIRELSHGQLFEAVNAQVVHQAYQFAYAICENQLGWMDRHWARERPTTYAHLRPSDDHLKLEAPLPESPRAIYGLG